MKRLFTGALVGVMILTSLGVSYAQEEPVVEDVPMDAVEEVAPEKVFLPVIRSDDSIAVGKNIIFSIEDNTPPEGARILEYLWEFGDGTFSSKEEVVHIFGTPGRYNVRLKTTWLPEGERVPQVAEYLKEVFVFERSMFLITDLRQNLERLEALKSRAEDQQVYLRTIRSAVSFRLKSGVLNRIERQLSDIENSDTVLIWSDSVDLFTVLNSFADRLDFQEKDLVVITDGNIGLVQNVLNGVFNVLKPRRILITRREAIDEFFTTQGEMDVAEVIRSRGYDLEWINAETIDQMTLFSWPSYGVNYLQEKGVEDSVLLMILFLPLIVTLVTLLRVVIGLSSIGARMPIVFTYTFLVLGWGFGLGVMLVLAFISYWFRSLLSKRHLLYTAKVGILLSILSLVLLLLLGSGLYWGGLTFDFSSALMMVLLASFIDRVAGVEGDKGAWSIVRVFFETLVIASCCFAVVSWDALQVLLLSHPEVLILFVVANILMGRFTGLRLMEYFRFREVLRYTEEE